MDVLSIRITEQSVIAVAEDRRSGCPVRQPSPKKSPLIQNPDCGFLPALRHNGESYLSFLYIKNSIRWVALNEDRLLLGKSRDLSTAVDGRKECLGIEFAECCGRYHGCYDLPSFLNVQKATFYEGCMNAEEGEKSVNFADRTAIRSK